MEMESELPSVSSAVVQGPRIRAGVDPNSRARFDPGRHSQRALVLDLWQHRLPTERMGLASTHGSHLVGCHLSTGNNRVSA